MSEKYEVLVKTMFDREFYPSTDGGPFDTRREAEEHAQAWRSGGAQAIVQRAPNTESDGT